MSADFPYSVEIKYAKYNDDRCCSEVSDHTGFHFYRCKHKVKETIDGIGFCGIHARSIKKWRAYKTGK